jgi:hypothetical protein
MIGDDVMTIYQYTLLNSLFSLLQAACVIKFHDPCAAETHCWNPTVSWQSMKAIEHKQRCPSK